MLGYLLRLLHSVLSSVFDEIAPQRDAGACLGQMEDAIFLLLGHLSETELSEYRKLTGRTRFIYERALLSKDAPQQAVNRILGKIHEQLRVLCFRSVEGQADLRGWLGVGEVIADVQCRLGFDQEVLDQSTIRSRFEWAFEGLNGRDRRLAEGYTDQIWAFPAEGLEDRLVGAYGDLSQVLSGQNAEVPERPENRSTAAEQSIFVEEIEGFAHAADFSICQAGGRIFQPSGAMRLIIHALHALRLEGILTPKWPTIVQKARLLYGDQRPMLELLRYAEDKRPDKEFKRQGLWDTLIKSNSKPKGSYSLVF